jgi:hypothetical protein
LLEDEESNPCGAVVKASERAAHEATCPHVSLHCSHDGCGVEVVRREFEMHVAACGHREVQCGMCEKVRAGIREGIAWTCALRFVSDQA